ncbi:unnamed protein product [Amoebophrya sp. A25]|nr:unnamed protein product [Amoebophrya sp. A25]|eukprot:GSA25T00006843001.1
MAAVAAAVAGSRDVGPSPSSARGRSLCSPRGVRADAEGEKDKDHVVYLSPMSKDLDNGGNSFAESSFSGSAVTGSAGGPGDGRGRNLLFPAGTGARITSSLFIGGSSGSTSQNGGRSMSRSKSPSTSAKYDPNRFLNAYNRSTSNVSELSNQNHQGSPSILDLSKHQGSPLTSVSRNASPKVRSVRQIMRFCGREQSKTSSSMSWDFPASPRNAKTCCLFDCTKAKVIEFITGRIGGELEPRTIDLKALAEKNGYESWEQVSVQDQALLIHQALSSNLAFLIDPTAGYMRIWDLVVMAALLFTCIVTPFEVGFILPLSGGSCGITALAVCNRCVDGIFLKDMIMQFFLKVEQKSRRGTVLLRDQRLIIRKYLTGWFIIDFLSIIPYDLITCWSGESLGTFRIFRLLRLMKLARIFRASRLFKRWQDHISLTFASIALMKFGLGILLLSHWVACLWGLTGLEFTGRPTNCFGDGPGGTNPDRDRFNDWDGSSWVRSTFVPGNNPDDARSYHKDDPCDEFVVFLIALHWSVMTITSIGYGDITPTQWQEYLICVLVMFIASFSWAYVMGNACSVIMNMNPVRVEFEQAMDQLNSMMKENDVPPALQRKLRENMREAQNLHRLLRSRELSKDMAPSIKCELIMHTSSQWIKDVSFLRGCSPQFMMELVDGFDVLMFARKEKINMPYVRLCVVERGAVGRAGKVLVPGSVWGEDVILADRRLQQVAHTTALTFVQLLSLGKEQLDSILRGYPRERRQIRKIACKLALRRAAVLVAQMSKKKTSLGQMATEGPRLLRIFDSGVPPDSGEKVRSKGGARVTQITCFEDLIRLFSQKELESATQRDPCAFRRFSGDAMEHRIRDDIGVLQDQIREISRRLDGAGTMASSAESKEPRAGVAVDQINFTTDDPMLPSLGSSFHHSNVPPEHDVGHDVGEDDTAAPQITRQQMAQPGYSDPSSLRDRIQYGKIQAQQQQHHVVEQDAVVKALNRSNKSGSSRGGSKQGGWSSSRSSGEQLRDRSVGSSPTHRVASTPNPKREDSKTTGTQPAAVVKVPSKNELFPPED